MKRIDTTFIFLCFFSLLITSCNRFSYEVIDKNKPVKGEYKKYKTAKDALDYYCPEVCIKDSLDFDNRLLAEGLIKQKKGDIDGADSLFTILFKQSKVLYYINIAKNILNSNLLLNEKYQDYVNIFKSNGEPDSVAKKRLGFPAYDDYPTKIEFGKEVDTIPINYDFGIIYVPVYLNEGKDYRLYKLDLNSPASYEYERNNSFDNTYGNAYDKVHLSNSTLKNPTKIVHNFSPDQISSNNDNLLPNKLGVIDVLKIGNIKINNFKTRIYDPNPSIFVEKTPILGFDFFKNFDIEIDTQKEILIIKKPKKKAISERNLFYVSYPIIQYISESGKIENSMINYSSDVSFYIQNPDEAIDSSKYSPIKKSFMQNKNYESYNNFRFYFANILLENNQTFIIRNSNQRRYDLNYYISNRILQIGAVHYDFLNGFFEFIPF